MKIDRKKLEDMARVYNEVIGKGFYDDPDEVSEPEFEAMREAVESIGIEVE